jgi:exodeoxyribonuclease VII large subunit
VDLYDGELMLVRSAMGRALNRAEAKLAGLDRRLQQQLPDRQLAQEKRHLAWLQRALVQQTGQRLAEQRQQLARFDETLAALDPTAVLRRGYAVVRSERVANATPGPIAPIVRNAESLAIGESISIQLGRGRVKAHVLSIEPDD